MVTKNRITTLLGVLQTDFDDMILIYKETLKDPFIEAGFEYNKKYPYNEETIKFQNEKVSEQERLIQLQVERLYGRIFNFVQTYNSIKGILIGIYPKEKKIIEKFYEEKNGFISREEMGNKLKHDPNKDLEYNQDVEKVYIRNKKGMTFSITNKGKCKW